MTSMTWLQVHMPNIYYIKFMIHAYRTSLYGTRLYMTTLVYILRHMAPRRQATNASAENNTPNAPDVAPNQQQMLTSLAALLQGATITPPATQEQVQARVINQFNSFTPPTFHGYEGPCAIEEWMSTLESIFEYMACTDAQKVSCAVFQLKEDARKWWNSYWRLQAEGEREALTWNNFKDIVMGQYFPRIYKQQMIREFIDLAQGEMTVTEYERKFNNMSRFAPHMVSTEDMKAQKFIDGLCPKIRHVLSGHTSMSYSEAVTRAGNVAASMELEKSQAPIVEHSNKRKWSEPNDEDTSKKVRSEDTTRPQPLRDNPICPTCNKRHKGECMRGQNRCFRCHEEGHKISQCQKRDNWTNRQNQEQGYGGRARVFGMNEKGSGEEI